jgi:hypothetical protein
MRVLLVSHRYPPDAVAGVERCTQMLAGELALRGDKVSIPTRRPSTGPPPTRIVSEQFPNGIVLL